MLPQIITNFGSNKTDLNLRYRLGLELALAKADFLNVPDLVLVQALSIFLFLLRRHDSPRFVWMMYVFILFISFLIPEDCDVIGMLCSRPRVKLRSGDELHGYLCS